jgi:hypothetical protein
MSGFFGVVEGAFSLRRKPLDRHDSSLQQQEKTSKLRSSLHDILRRSSSLTASALRQELGGSGPGEFSTRQEKTESKNGMQQIARHQEVYA